MIGLAQYEHTPRTYRKTKIHVEERTLILTNKKKGEIKNNHFFFCYTITICYSVLYIIQFSGRVCIKFIVKQYVTQVYNIYFRSHIT